LLPDVPYPIAEGPCLGSVFLIIRQQMSVGREHRATASGVRYYGLDTSTKSVDVLSRQDARALELAGVRM
jgi:hypothetical protein